MDLNPNTIDPGNEYLVLDADPSQQSAISAVLAGHDLIVQGPPGTGKSQTIANLIVEAVARGKKILFVAQKRAAIDAVVNNLRERDLADLVLDLHDPKTSRKAVVEQLRHTMERAGHAPPTDVGANRKTLVERRRQLQRYSEIMTTVRKPFDSSIAELEQRLLMLPPERDPGVSLSKSTLARISSDDLRDLEEDLKQFVESDGLRLWLGQSPWAKARGITDQDKLQAARDHLEQLTGRELQDARSDFERLLGATGLPRPATLAEWNDPLGLMIGVARTVATHGPEVFDAALDDYRAAFATQAWRRDAGVSIGFWRRRSLRRAAMERRSGRADRATMRTELSDAVTQRDLWGSLTGGQVPKSIDGVDELVLRYERLCDDLAALGAIATLDRLAEWPEPLMDRALRDLKADEEMLIRLPELNPQRTRYEELGLSELLEYVAHRNAGPVEAAEVLRFAWLSSALRELRATVPEYGRFSAAAQQRVIEEFQEADLTHIETTNSRVRRLVAEQQMHARDQWRDQRSIVQDEIARRSRHKPIRQLVDEAPDLLLAVQPCWAMSPLVVSQVLPVQRLFDLVVFDEASQIEPADAIPAIMRGEHVVVAGDKKQLPPTPFFTTAVDEDQEIEEDGDLGAFESILEVLDPLVPSRTLAWHYRSQDDRLIAFSNTAAIYGDHLVTFPSTARRSALRHVLVNASFSPGEGSYSLTEVERVVELVIEHAEQNPDDSLGVITFGVNAANRIQNTLRPVLTQRLDLSDFFDEDAPVGRRFFVKSIENVQGDERDAIILTIGGSRTATGALSHNFGPINQDGGERRLNVAVTRARRSMTIVSTFGAQDFIEDKLTSTGLRFLRDYMQFIARESQSSGNKPEITRVSPIEQRLIEHLQAVGVPTFPRYGKSRSRIDVAIEHPDRPGHLLLAIETDRDGYHAPERSVRERDRLRPQQLEKMGWRHHRVWTTEWLRDPHGQIDQASRRCHQR